MSKQRIYAKTMPLFSTSLKKITSNTIQQLGNLFDRTSQASTDSYYTMAQINLSSKLTIASTSCILLPGIIHLSLSPARRFHPRQKLDRIRWKANDSTAKRTRAFKQIGLPHVFLYLRRQIPRVTFFQRNTKPSYCQSNPRLVSMPELLLHILQPRSF